MPPTASRTSSSAAAYKGYVIKEYFANYFLHSSDVTFDLAHNRMEVHERHAEPWRVTLVDTGHDSGTGGRLKRVAAYLKDETDFCFTYGDGVADVDVTALLAQHRARGWRPPSPPPSPQPASVRSKSTLTPAWYSASARSRRARVPASMPASSCSSPRCWT